MATRTQPNQKSSEKKIWRVIPSTNKSISIFGTKISLLSFIIGTILAIISIILTFLFGLGIIKPIGSTPSTFTSTIKLSGWDKWGDTIIYSLMKEEIVLGNDYMKQPMNKNGQIIFTKVPNEYKNKKNSIHITKSQNIPFYLTDSIITIREEESKISIGLKGLDKLCGFVRDEKGNGIFNATIVLAGISKSTNNRGYFEIDNIPINKQRQVQEIEISKDGYKPYHDIIQMLGEEPIKIILPFNK